MTDENCASVPHEMLWELHGLAKDNGRNGLAHAIADLIADTRQAPTICNDAAESEELIHYIDTGSGSVGIPFFVAVLPFLWFFIPFIVVYDLLNGFGKKDPVFCAALLAQPGHPDDLAAVRDLVDRTEGRPSNRQLSSLSRKLTHAFKERERALAIEQLIASAG